MTDNYDPTKKPHQTVEYTEEQLKELILCADDPFYFIENYVKIQHPVDGIVPLTLFPFQHDIIRGFHENQNCAVLTARQMGKCLETHATIRKNDEQIEIGTLVKLTFSEKIVEILEGWLLELSK